MPRWQLLQFVCDAETSSVWSVTQGGKQETSLLRAGRARSSCPHRQSLSFLSPSSPISPSPKRHFYGCNKISVGWINSQTSLFQKKKRGKMITAIWKTFCRLSVSYKAKLSLKPYEPAMTLLGDFPNEPKTYVHTKSHTWRVTALFTVAQI